MRCGGQISDGHGSGSLLDVRLVYGIIERFFAARYAALSTLFSDILWQIFMANFNTHLNVAFMASGTLSLTVYKAGLVDDSGFLMCVALGTIGGLLPDLDSDNSTPIKLGFNITSFIFAFGPGDALA